MFDNSTLKSTKIVRKSSGFRYILTVQILTKTLEKGYHFVMDVGDKLYEDGGIPCVIDCMKRSEECGAYERQFADIGGKGPGRLFR